MYLMYILNVIQIILFFITYILECNNAVIKLALGGSNLRECQRYALYEKRILKNVYSFYSERHSVSVR